MPSCDDQIVSPVRCFVECELKGASARLHWNEAMHWNECECEDAVR
jgi:hypothetical protein